MAQTRSVDALLTQVENQKMDQISGRVTPNEPVSYEPPDEPEQQEAKPIAKPEVKAEPEAKRESRPLDKPKEVAESKVSETVDEYGNDIPPERTYSQREVEAMMRDRLSRGRHAEQQQQQPQQQAVQQAARDFTADPNSSEPWEAQLDQFIETKFNKMKEREQQANWQRQEAQTQAQFEEKFTTGMNRYTDWSDTVSGKPITNAMMLAARSMENPAGFVYSACKNHPAEIERIAKIADPYQQSAEIGKLEATMKKTKAVTAAPKPLGRTVSDTGTKQEVKHSIDDKIRQDAQKRFRR